jgi:hypothetical protein
MDDEKVNKFFAAISEQFIMVTGQLSVLKASVNVLKVVLASEMNADRPEEFLALFRKLEQKFLDSDPQEQERKEAAATIEAIKLWKKHDRGHEA